MEQAVKKRNRYDTSPIRIEGKLRTIPSFRLTELQLEILKCLAYDRFLSWDYIVKLAGSHRSHVLQTLEIMRSEPYAYVKVCDEQADRSKSHLYQNIKQQYELTALGREVIFDKFGLRVPAWKPTSYIAHHIMGDHFMAGLRIGVKESAGRFVMRSSYELMANEKLIPEATRKSKAPFHIPLGDSIKSEGGKEVPHTIRPDREIFGLIDQENDRGYLFGGLETGTGSETHQPRTPRHDHSYTESKFLDYRRIIERGIYQTHFGFPNFYMIFVERNMGRFEKPFELWRDITENVPWMRPYIFFKTHHLFTEKYEASGRALTDPFFIVGEDGRVVQHSLV